MSLIEMSLSDVVKKQYRFKWNAFLGAFGSLSVVQILGLLFTIGGVGGHGFSGGNVSIDITYYSADTVIVFTMVWAFITAILMTTKAARYDDFSFVNNRISSHIANILFLVTAAIIGGVSAYFTKSLLKVITYFNTDVQFIFDHTHYHESSEFLLGITATVLYVLLFSASGYVIGMLIQLSRIFIVIVPALVIGISIVSDFNGIYTIIEFIFIEGSMYLFSLKVIIISVLLFLISFVISNRMEVRR